MTSDDRTIPILTHVLAFLFGWLAPLIILLVSENETVKRHARRAFNWQMSLTISTVILLIAFFISIPLIIVLIGILTLVLSLAALATLSIMDLVFSIIAAVRASNDELYDYPFAIRFLKDPSNRTTEESTESTDRASTIRARTKSDPKAKRTKPQSRRER